MGMQRPIPNLRSIVGLGSEVWARHVGRMAIVGGSG